MYITCITMLVVVDGVQRHGGQGLVDRDNLFAFLMKKVKLNVSKVVRTSVYNIVVDYEHL